MKKRKERNCRFLEFQRIFKPIDIPLKDLEVIDIFMDEFEAVRLCDYENKSQIEAGNEMNISRGTVQRLLISGRKKIMDAFLHEKALNIQTDSSYFENTELLLNKKIKNLNEDVKIALPTSDKDSVEEHFGKATYFCIVNLVSSKIKSIEFLEAPDHQPGRFPQFLNENNVKLIIAYGMGNRALDFFNDYNIEVVLGAKGKINNILKGYIGGENEISNSSNR